MNKEKAKSNKFNSYELSEQTPISVIKTKLRNNTLSIEDILLHDECIYDLKTNNKSKYKKILTTDNIIKLIDYSLYSTPKNQELEHENISMNISLKFSYYSSELLCSRNILNFRKSIKNIETANKMQSKEETNLINMEELSDEDDKGDDNFLEYSLSNLKETEFYENEKIVDLYEPQGNEKEIQTTSMELSYTTIFEEKYMEIINEILDKIFNFLNQEEIFNKYDTNIGYFQKLVNFLSIYEPKILIEYLFNKDENQKLIIKKFYKYMNKVSIENILENILNYLSDKENKESNLNDLNDSKFNIIIMDLLDEITKFIINKEYNFDDDNYNNYYEDKSKIFYQISFKIK